MPAGPVIFAEISNSVAALMAVVVVVGASFTMIWRKCVPEVPALTLELMLPMFKLPAPVLVILAEGVSALAPAIWALPPEVTSGAADSVPLRVSVPLPMLTSAL